MAVHNFRYNGQTYSIQTMKLVPEDEQFACFVFMPYHDQGYHPIVNGFSRLQLFPDENEGVEFAKNLIRNQVPQQPFLRCFMNQLKEAVTANPTSSKRLLLSSNALIDWRKLTEDDFQEDGWENVGDYLASTNLNNEQFLQSLKRLVNRFHRMDVEMAKVPYMEIVSAAN